jgi:mercuric ion transport protein
MLRSITRTAHPIVAAIFVACAVVQVFLAGLGVFDDPRAFVTHREFGYLFGWLTLAILVLALLGRMPRRATGLSVLLLVLFALQSLLVAVRVDLPAIAALHPLNGFAILGVGVMTARSSWRLRREPTTATATAAPQGAGSSPLLTPEDAR